MAHLETIFLVYAVIGGLIFLGVLLFFTCVIYTNSKAGYCNDYYYPNHNKGHDGVMPTMAFGIFVSLLLAVLWPLIPPLLSAVWFYGKCQERRSRK